MYELIWSHAFRDRQVHPVHTRHRYRRLDINLVTGASEAHVVESVHLMYTYVSGSSHFPQCFFQIVFERETKCVPAFTTPDGSRCE